MRQPRNDILSVRIATTAWRQLGVVPSNTFARIKGTLYSLAENPRNIPVVPESGAGSPPSETSAAERNVLSPESAPLCFTVDEFVAMYTVDFELRLLTLVEVARRLPEA